MNINDIVSQPTMFRDLKSSYALCYENGTIHQVFTTFASANFLLVQYKLGSFVCEVIQYKGKIISYLGVKSE